MKETKPFSGKLNLTNPCKNKEGKTPKPASPDKVLGLSKLVLRVAIGQK